MIDRAGMILDIARSTGALVVVSREAAAAWRAEWWAILAAAPKAPAPAPKPARPRAPRAPRPRRVPLPASSVVPGVWVSFRPHLAADCPDVVGRVVAIIPRGESARAVVPEKDHHHMERHASLDRSVNISRILLAVPNTRRLAGVLRTVPLGTVLARGRILDGQPPIPRLLEPLRSGVEVSWTWHSPHGLSTNSGRIIGYVPAERSISDVLPNVAPPRDMLLVSAQDRYIVEVLPGPRRILMAPAAHLIERALASAEQENQCAV